MLVQPVSLYGNYRNNYINHSKTSFSGHSGIETTYNLGKKVVLTTETAFFREPDTLEFVRDYANKTFKNEPVKKIVVGACSSGEEAWSYKMLFNGTPVRIYAFDPAARLITLARKGLVEISEPRSRLAQEFVKDFKVSGYKDSYLAFDRQNLTPQESERLGSFNKMFEFVPPSKNFVLGIHHYDKAFPDSPHAEFEKKVYRLKDENGTDCVFFVSDVRDFRDKKEYPLFKNHIFSFRNALYHLMTKKVSVSRVELPRNEIVKTLAPVFSDINKSLDKKGLLVFGENENMQGSNMSIISEMLPNLGFEPVYNNISRSYQHIWAKNREL